MQCGGVNPDETDTNNKLFCADYFCSVFKNTSSSVKGFSVFSIRDFFLNHRIWSYIQHNYVIYTCIIVEGFETVLQSMDQISLSSTSKKSH